MLVWLALPFLPAERLIEIAKAAEAAGIDGVAFSDHLCVPEKVDSSYPYGGGKPTALPFATEFPDPLVAIAALGAATTDLRLTTHVLLVPLRHPVLLAKQVATASAIVGGRLDLGVGVGWMREEFDAMGVTFEQRGSIMDEAMPLLRRLWTGLPVNHRGDHFRLDGIAVNPVPPEPLRMLVGGYSMAALRRAVVLGDGWVGVNPTADELARLLQRLEKLRVEADEPGRPFEIRTGVRGPVDTETVRALDRLGVTSLVVAPWQVAGAQGLDCPIVEAVDRLADLRQLVATAD